MFVKSLLLLLISTISCKNFLVHVKNTEFSIRQESSFFTQESAKIVDTFKIGDFSGYIMDYDSYPIHLFDYSPFVETVEEDKQVSINRNTLSSRKKKFFDFSENPYVYEDDLSLVQDDYSNKAFYLQDNPTWGLDRTDQRGNSLNKKYYYNTASGSGVNVFIVDTGIDISHPEFEGRASWGINTADNVNTDCNSHGTHVSGTIGSKTYGLAKKANLIAVKVLDCRGSGSYSGIIKGMEYVINKHKQNNGAPSVVNMSLGGPKSAMINKAISELVKAGVHTVVAAGNENSDACNTSPASEDSAFTVGAVSISNEMASFSNWGKCVDILAPGVDILSTIPSGKTGGMSGTSMASPHTAGVYALFLSSSEENKKLSPASAKKLLTDGCTKDTIKKVRPDTVNCLLFSLL
jgi:subtilisin family serine protease